MTLRPASATWSSAVTPGVLPTTSSGRSATAGVARSRSRREDVPRTTGHRRLVASAPVLEDRRRRRSLRRSVSLPAQAAKRGLELAPRLGRQARVVPRRPRQAPPRPSSAPLTSSASSSTNRSTTRPRDDDVDLVEAQLDARVGGLGRCACRRSWRIVTSSTSGASPASSRTSDRASDAASRPGGASGRPDPRAPRAAIAPPAPSVLPSDLTETTVPRRVRRRRTAIAGLGERPVRRVDVAVLELRRPCRRGPAGTAPIASGVEIALARPRGRSRGT